MVPLRYNNLEGTRIDDITSQFGLEQLIHEPTNIIGRRSPCIDSIFASQPNLVVESGVQSFLYQNCYHQIVFANVDHIREAINGFHWKFISKYERQWGVCISRPPALRLAPSLSPGPQPCPPICVCRPWPPICIYWSWPPIVFTSPGPQFAFTSPGSQFVFTGPGLQFYFQSRAWICIYQPCLFNLCLYLRLWPTTCINGPGPEFAFTLLLVVVAVVAVVVVLVISLEQIIPIFVCRF